MAHVNASNGGNALQADVTGSVAACLGDVTARPPMLVYRMTFGLAALPPTVKMKNSPAASSWALQPDIKLGL